MKRVLLVDDDRAIRRIVQAKTFLIRPFRVGELVNAVRAAMGPSEAGGSHP